MRNAIIYGHLTLGSLGRTFSMYLSNRASGNTDEDRSLLRGGEQAVMNMREVVVSAETVTGGRMMGYMTSNSTKVQYRNAQ